MKKLSKKGTKFTFGGIDYWAPPPPEDKSKILYSDLPKKEQMWRREPLPDFYRELRPEEKRIQEEQWKLVQAGDMDRVEHFNPLLEDYRRKQWDMRLNGVHIMVNGKCIYLTGPWWFYLQWCQFDHAENNGYPLFYISQQKRFYFREACYYDDLSLGYVIIGARGFGKTTEETAMMIESMTRGPRRRTCALQSKTGPDAQNVIFKGKFAPCYKSLPDFFKPNSNHGSNPENKLSFFLDAKFGSKAKDAITGEGVELENTIYHVSAKEKALDGETLAEIFQDEIGKTDPKKEADVYKRMNVNRFCVYRNDRKVGMIRATTTVEEMDKGGDECKKVWDESDQSKRTENGYTRSGLYRLFIGALETTTKFADEYGMIDEAKAMKYHMAEREDRKHDSHALSSWIRKNPIYEEESFIKDASQSVFNVFILTERLQKLHSMKQMPFVRGNFYWVNGEKDGLVDFEIDDHAGRFYVAKLLDVKKDKKNLKPGEVVANQMEFYKDHEGKKIWKPKNNKYFRIGTDPIKYSKTKDPRASKTGMHGFELYNPAIDHEVPMENWKTYNFMFEYLHRPEDPEISYEDTIMAMRYYGCSVLPESNIKELVKHLNDRGYGECVIYRNDYDHDFIQGSQNDAGISSNQEVIDTYVRRLISFVNRHGHRLKFPRTIEALLEFEPENTTMYDAVVSMGYALFAAEAPLELEVEIQETVDWFDEYDNSGSRSRLIDAF